MFSTYYLNNKTDTNSIILNFVQQGYLTFHSYGQYILYPWGYDRKVPPDYTDLERVGRRMGEAMLASGGHSYTVGNSATTLYSAAGGADDWAKGTAGVKYTYTIELPDRGQYGFMLPASYIQSVAKEALAALKVLAQEVQNTPWFPLQSISTTTAYFCYNVNNKLFCYIIPLFFYINVHYPRRGGSSTMVSDFRLLFDNSNLSPLHNYYSGISTNLKSIIVM